LEINDYQTLTNETAVYPEKDGLVYTALGLASEAGEYAGKIKKYIRGDKELDHEELMFELGDVLWYVAQCAETLSVTLDEVAQRNIIKLERRKINGTLKGEGDSR
jgi:NTP pyrophosphatase (non-canonical NTP hydrolase)